MRIQKKSGIFAVLAVAVLCISAAAAPALVNSIGVVLHSNNASINGSPAVNRSAISSGDTLATQSAGELRALFGSSQIYLFPNSNVSIGQTANGFSADLTHGSALLSSGAGETFEILADGAIVQPKGDQPSVAQISWVSPTELLVSSRAGDLEVTMGNETQTVNAGSSYRMMISPASQPASSPAPQSGGGGNGAFYLVALAIVGAGTGVALWRAFESPTN